jgi:hypothetical protein
MTAAQPATNGAPAWLEALGVGRGDYLFETKPRLKAVMKSRAFGETARVWACASLFTMGYQQEMAVKMHNGKLVPLAPEDISRLTGIDKSNVRRGLRNMKAEGMGDVQGSKKGAIRIYSWAVPRPPDPQMVVARDCQNAPPEGIDPALWKLCKRFKISLPEKMVVARDNQIEIENAVRDLEKAEMVVKSALRKLSEPTHHIGKKETERNIEENERTDEHPPLVQVPPSDPEPPVRSFVPPPDPEPPRPEPEPLRIPEPLPVPPEPPPLTLRERLSAFLTGHCPNITLRPDRVILGQLEAALGNSEGALNLLIGHARETRMEVRRWAGFMPAAISAGAQQRENETAEELNRAARTEELKRMMSAYEPYSEEIPLASAIEEPAAPPEPPPPEPPPPGSDPDHEERLRNQKERTAARRAAEKARIEENRLKYRRPLEGTT